MLCFWSRGNAICHGLVALASFRSVQMVTSPDVILPNANQTLVKGTTNFLTASLKQITALTKCNLL